MNQLLVLVSGGGGKNSLDILLSVIRAAKKLRSDIDLHWVIVGGPLIRATEWDAVRSETTDSRIHVVRYLPNMIDYLRAADLFVGTCGYNISAEIMATGTPAIFIPLPQYGETEQLLRATRLAKHGIGQCLEPGENAVDKLTQLLERWLRNPRVTKTPCSFRMDGAQTVANSITADFDDAVSYGQYT